MSSFSRKVGRDNRAAANLDEVHRALSVLADPERGIQLQALVSYVSKEKENYGEVVEFMSHATFPGSDIDSQLNWVARQSNYKGIYYITNPVDLALSTNAKNNNILKRHLLFIDVDRDKTLYGDDMATDAERQAARDECWRLTEDLEKQGWPAPMIVSSGNGWQVLYKIDMPNNPLSREIIKGFLDGIEVKYKGIGSECCDARRLAKLPGTWVRKGTEYPDRPWRMAQIAELPATFGMEILTPELIRDTTAWLGVRQAPPAPETVVDMPLPKPERSTFSKPVPDSDMAQLRAYASKALENELKILGATLPGSERRNTQLNMSAFAIGQLISANWSGLNRLDAELRLTDYAKDIGLTDSEILKTIKSGIEAGMAQPRPLPDGMTLPKPSKDGRHTKRNATPAPGPDEPLTVCLADVMPKAIDWLMPNRIPRQFVTVFAGRTGIGKSSVALDIVARISTGGEIPCSPGERFQPGNVLIISEDSHEYILAPRLLAAGADMKRVRAMTWKAMGAYSLNDTDMLAKAVSEFGGEIALIIIDPPTNFLDDADEHKNSEVRRIVMKIVEWLQDRVGVAVLFIMHVNKNCGKGVEALNRVMGSIAWVTTCRIAHSFSSDPDDKTRGLFLPMKTNLGPLGKGLAYRIVTRAGSAGVEWIGEVDTTADEAMAGEKKSKPPTRGVVASQWLIEKFREKLEWTSGDLKKAASEEGVSHNALFDAKRILELPKARKVSDPNGDVTWVWWVPQDWSGFDEDEPESTVPVEIPE